MSTIIEEQQGIVFPTEKDTQTAIYTIGYEGDDLEGFLWRLQFDGICRIIDVRCNPISRKPGFAKAPLKAFLEANGIQYVHFPQLGIPSHFRKSLKNKDDYVQLFEMYDREILPNQSVAIAQVAELLKEMPSALMCFEHNPEKCHRTHLAKRIHELYGFEIRES